MKAWLKENAIAIAYSVVALIALAAIATGAAMERPSLGFIVPGGIVLGLMLLGRLFTDSSQQ